MEGEKHSILIIDDEDVTHQVLKRYLSKDYDLIHAHKAQEGINIISEVPVNLILSDIHMPGMSGIEFLESLTKDAEKKNIPVLVMTSLPTVEKEKKALNLGAADFIDKVLFQKNPEELLERVQMKLVTNIVIPDISERLAYSKKELTKKLMFEVASGDFMNTTNKLSTELRDHFELDHISFWTIQQVTPRLILSHGIQPPADYGPGQLKDEKTFRAVLKQRKPYLTNNVLNGEVGILKELSKEEGLPAEIGIPLFAITDKELIKNNMKIPKSVPVFGYIVLKRKELFTTKEYKLLSRLLIQTGTILWRLYDAI